MADFKKFDVGDVVDVKGHGRATVVEPMATEASSPNFGRYRIQYHKNGTTYWCRPKLLRLMHPTKKRILVARSTCAYRDAMVHNIDRPDVCLEIGCHEGLTTNIISNRATFVTGIDTASEVVAIARSRHPHLTFHQQDGLDTAASRALSPTNTYTRICIDISGKAPLELICQMIVAQCAAFPEAALIVKNEQLFDTLTFREHGAPAAPIAAIQTAHPTASAAAGRSEPTATAQGSVQAPAQTSALALADAAAAGQCPLSKAPQISGNFVERMSLCRNGASTNPPPQPSFSQPDTGRLAAGCGAMAIFRDEQAAFLRLGLGCSQGRDQQGLQRPHPQQHHHRCRQQGGPEQGDDGAAAALPDSCEYGDAGCGGTDSNASGSGVEAEARAGTCPRAAAALRLEELLGRELLSECEVFRHQYMLPRSRASGPQGGHPRGEKTKAGRSGARADTNTSTNTSTNISTTTSSLADRPPTCHP